MGVSDTARRGTDAGVLADGGEMGARMRAFDWASTPLGPLEAWPQSLHTAVSICLASRFPMLIWWGPELVMLYNDAYRPILGATKHPHALGQRGRECWPEIWDVIGPMLEGVLARGEATWSDDQLLLLDRNGYVEECYFTFSYSPIRDETGGIGGVFTAVTETTGRVLGERRLAVLRDLATRSGEARTAEEACLLAAASLSSDQADVPFALLYLLDADRRSARLTGASGLVGDVPAMLGLFDLTAAETLLARAAHANTVEAVNDIGAHFAGLLVGAAFPPRAALVLPLAQAGQERAAGLLVAGVSPLLALDDDYRGFFALLAGHIGTAIGDARAYEEERRRAEALAELDRAKMIFFSNVSHEFRTPLTLLLGPLEAVLSAPPETPLGAERSQLETAHRNSLRLLRLVNTLLDFSRFEAGRTEASYVPTDLAAYTAELAGVFRSAVEQAGLRLIVDCPPLPEPVYVDQEMWEKVVLNLLSNAFKFTLEGEIAVCLRPAGDQVELAVRDTGTGIPAEELPHLFERFHRVRGTRARTHEGTGIGLALVRELVALHGGRIDAESTPGVGTTFTVTLPFGMAHLPPDRVGAPRGQASTALGASSFVGEALRWLPTGTPPELQVIADVVPADGGAVAAGDGTARARVLLADDSADLREYLTRLLAGRYDVQAVANGAEALAAALARPPDLVLGDVMMPELDGVELLRALRADPRTSAVPVVLLSARAGEEATVAGLEASADDYLVKPFSARELLARVGTHLELARVRREAREAVEAERDRLHAEIVARTDAEEALRRSNEQLRAALGAARMIAWEWDPAADAVTTSGNMAEIYGISGLDSAAQGLSLIHPDDRARHETIIRAAAAQAGSYASTFRFIRPDTGEVIWLEERAAAALDDAGRLKAISGVTLDVTARKRDEERERLLARTTELLDAALDYPGMLQRAAELAVPAFADWCAIGLLREDGSADWPGLAHRDPELAEQARAWRTRYPLPSSLQEAFRERLRRGEPRLVPVVSDDMLRVQAGDEGHLAFLRELGFRSLIVVPLLVRDHVLGTIEFVTAGSGRVYGSQDVPLAQEFAHRLALAIDNARLYEAERAARAAAEELAQQVRDERDRLEQILDTLPVGVVIVDASGRVEMLNQAGRDIVGINTRGQPLPSPGAESTAGYRVRRPDGTPYPSDELPLSRSLRHGEEVRGDPELHVHAQTGRETSLLVNSAPLRAGDGTCSGALAIFQDISELRSWERAREEFLSSAAHDLKNPLTSILGQTQLAQRRLARLDLPETAPVLGQLARIQEGADAMLGLINELVDVTRQQMGGVLDLHREPTELVGLVRMGVEVLRDASGRSIHLEATVPELRAEIDAARIARVVGNLLSNAVKYSPAESSIWVRIEQDAGPSRPEAVISVRDEGIGIPAVDLPHIFDRFRRASNVARHIQGTGIGLASARGIVEQHGGSIMAQSVEGVGTTFTVRLPVQSPSSGEQDGR